MLLIRNTFLIDPKTQRQERADILVCDGKIAAIGDAAAFKEMTDASQLQIYDGEGLVAAPGLIDVHVHFRDPGFTYKEDILSGSRAAAAGGFTTVVLMANTNPVVDNQETLSYVLEKGKETGIHVKSCCSITKGMRGEELTDMSYLLQQGAAGFTDDGKPLLDEALTYQAMQEAARLGTVLSFHEENPAYIKDNGINAGEASAYYGIGGSSREAEISMVRRDIRLAAETGAVINIQHISTKEAVMLVREAKKAGHAIHAEATPHHIALTQKAAIRCGTLAKMNPPLREELDRAAIIEGLKDGTIDLIATDHAPHSRKEKEKTITQAPSGIIGLETALPLCITNLVKPGHLTLMQLLEKLTRNPAKLYGLDAGYLAVGGPADIVLFDADAENHIEGFLSKSWNSPFLGEKLTGKVRCTICGGRIVYQK